MQVDSFRLEYLKDVLRRETNDETVAEVLKKAGIHRKENHIEVVKEAEFVRLACQRLGDPLFGVKTGLAYRRSETLAGFIARYSRSLEMAIRNSQKVHKAIYPAYDFHLKVSGNSASIEIDAVDEQLLKYHRHRELLVFWTLAVFRDIVQQKFVPIQIRIDHEVGKAAEEIRKLAGCPVVFGAERLEIILPLSALAIPVPTYYPELRDHLVAYGNRLLSDALDAKPSTRARIEGVLTRGLPNRLVPLEEVASELGMGPRTLGRRLKDEGCTFRDVVDDLRFDLAKTYLKDGISVTEVGFFLDYADTASFSTAFKRWTNGHSPRQYLKNLERGDVAP